MSLNPSDLPEDDAQVIDRAPRRARPAPFIPGRAKLVLEAALLAASEPMSLPDLRRLFDDDPGAEVIKPLLAELVEDWQGRGAELVRLASGWRFQTRTEFQPWLDRLRTERPVKYSRAVMETLAIVAYRQPVTRGDIEDIRGVVVSTNIIKTLESRGWIDVVGHREAPGRPALYATTKRFLDDLSLSSLAELPPLTEIEKVMDFAQIAPQTSTEEPGEADPERAVQVGGPARD